jgi:hypothetical protein
MAKVVYAYNIFRQKETKPILQATILKKAQDLSTFNLGYVYAIRF